MNYIQANRRLSDEQAAKLIGQFFPDIKDKLLNTIQLSEISHQNNSLILASIEKRSIEIKPFEFTSSIDLKSNKKYMKYMAYPAAILFLLLLFVPQYLTESTKRIVNYNLEFNNQMLFQISPLNDHFTAFKNENYTLEVDVKGNALPEFIYVLSGGRKAKMKMNEQNYFEYTFSKVQDDFKFQIEAADYLSSEYQVEVLVRPDIKSFNIKLDYPGYTGKQNDIFENIGNLTIPEGTQVSWTIKTVESQSVKMKFDLEENSILFDQIGDQLYESKRPVKNSDNYSLQLENEHSLNKDSISYHIEVIKDEFPKISLDAYQDTTLFAFILFNGLVSDDYGISRLEFVYTDKEQRQTLLIPINKNLSSQNYFYQWNLDSLNLKEGESLEYFVRVWDNDAFNGYKPSKTATYTFKLPEKTEIKDKLNKQAEGAKKEVMVEMAIQLVIVVTLLCFSSLYRF